MADQVYLAGEGAVWAQEGGPGTNPTFLGCHELGDITVPRGDVKLYYCPDPSQPNTYKVVGSSIGAPGLVTTSIKTDLAKLRDILEKIRCPTGLYVHRVDCGAKNVWGNYYRSFILKQVRISQQVLSKLTSRDPDTQDRAEQTFEIAAMELQPVFPFTALRVSITETEELSSISFCDAYQCEGNCGQAVEPGDTLFVGTKTLAGSPVNVADVWEVTDDGGDWDLWVTDPFGAAEVIASIRCFQLDRNTTRVIVARGTTDPGNPMEIAYSDDHGVSWTHVNVGTVNGQYAMGHNALYVYDQYNIWLATSGGYIYYSSDSGATWAAQTDGTATVQNLWAVDMYNNLYGWACGANNAILRTVDGGEVWSLVTGPAGQGADTCTDISENTMNVVWVSYNDGNMYRSDDAGETWAIMTFPGSGTGSVADMEWRDEYQAAIVHNNAAGVGAILVTINGGANWETMDNGTPTNAGLNCVVFPTPYKLFAGGAVYGGTGMFIKATAGG